MSTQATQPDTLTRCAATTKSGSPCKNYAIPDSAYCRIHQPESQPADSPYPVGCLL
jgi:hypothetical protein